jgi:hypothetical protein
LTLRSLIREDHHSTMMMMMIPSENGEYRDQGCAIGDKYRITMANFYRTQLLGWEQIESNHRTWKSTFLCKNTFFLTLKFRRSKKLLPLPVATTPSNLFHFMCLRCMSSLWLLFESFFWLYPSPTISLVIPALFKTFLCCLYMLQTWIKVKFEIRQKWVATNFIIEYHDNFYDIYAFEHIWKHIMCWSCVNVAEIWREIYSF